MEQSKRFYTTIPGYIRDDERLPLSAMMLFGDIAALAQSNGFCFATNQYLANMNKVDKLTISRLVSKLEDCGHIKTTLKRGENGEIEDRFIELSVPIGFLVNRGIAQNVKYNSTVQNSTVDTTIVKPSAPQKEPLSEKVTWGNEKSDLQRFMAEYLKNCMPSIYKEADRKQVGGFFKQYGKMFSLLLGTAGTLDVAIASLHECIRYYKKLGYPWGLKAMNSNWAEFTNAVMEKKRRDNAD